MFGLLFSLLQKAPKGLLLPQACILLLPPNHCVKGAVDSKAYCFSLLRGGCYRLLTIPSKGFLWRMGTVEVSPKSSDQEGQDIY